MKFLSKVMENVAVMDLLSTVPGIGIFVTPFISIVFEDTCMYFDEV